MASKTKLTKCNFCTIFTTLCLRLSHRGRGCGCRGCGGLPSSQTGFLTDRNSHRQESSQTGILTERILTVGSSQRAAHSSPLSAPPAVYFVLCTMYSVLCDLYFALCTMHSVLCDLYFVLCMDAVPNSTDRGAFQIQDLLVWKP